jgi:glyoxylase-like metal-dependent hydrolase (beta-lactamase superfamily II)
VSKEFRLHALPAGTLPTPAWATVFGTNDTTLIDLGFYVWIITDGDTVGLVDTGLPLDPTEADAVSDANRAFDQASHFRDVRCLPELLADAGLRGADVDFVAITQTVTYHTGGIDAMLMPRAHFYVPFAGVREMLVDQPGHPATQFYFTERSWTALRQLAVESRLHCVDRPTEIVPGIVFETTGGHHPGSGALQIRTGMGTTGLLETAFLQTNLDRQQPIGIAEDISTCRAVIRRYLRDCDQVIAIHDPANVQRFPLDGFRAESADHGREEDLR